MNHLLPGTGSFSGQSADRQRGETSRAAISPHMERGTTLFVPPLSLVVHPESGNGHSAPIGISPNRNMVRKHPRVLRYP
jgi:hypothetical protein